MVVVTRPLRGSRLSCFYPHIPEAGPSLSDLDSAFQLQEYISLLTRHNPHDVETIVTPPGRVKKGEQEDKSDVDTRNDGVDEACWIYEQLRRLAQDLTHPLVTSLQLECTRASCPEMKAGEWLYLCVAHGNDGAMECCAIDYIVHTLDSATALLNSPRAFPSRINIPQPSVRHFSSLARRLGRIFAHAYYHHREAFESSEAENSLYARFLALTARFDLVPPEFLVIPARMINPDASSSSGSSTDGEPPRLLNVVVNRHDSPTTDSMSDKRTASTFGPSMTDSPRKFGRNRTDTMVFSDIETFNEVLRGQYGSPPESQGVGASAAGRAGGLGLETSGSISHADNLETLAGPGETCPPTDSSENTKDKDGKAYTLTFSASGTMKTALPPGISQSGSNASGLGLDPSPLQPFSNTNQTKRNTQFLNTMNNEASGSAEQLERGRGYADSVNLEEQAPSLEGEPEEPDDTDNDGEESALHTVLSQELAQGELERDEAGNPRLIDLLARKEVLEGGMSEVDLHEDEKWSSARSSGGRLVLDDPPNEANASEDILRVIQPSRVSIGDIGSGVGTMASASEAPTKDEENVSSPSKSKGQEGQDSALGEQGEQVNGGEKDPDISLEMDLADVENALRE